MYQDFTEYSEKTLSKIKDYKYRLQIVDYILKNRDIKYIINDRLREEMKKENKFGYNSFFSNKSKNDSKSIKKGGY